MDITCVGKRMGEAHRGDVGVEVRVLSFPLARIERTFDTEEWSIR